MEQALRYQCTDPSPWIFLTSHSSNTCPTSQFVLTSVPTHTITRFGRTFVQIFAVFRLPVAPHEHWHIDVPYINIAASRHRGGEADLLRVQPVDDVHASRRVP